MPKRKVFMIVTNDEYETPVICDVVGKQAVADYLGITLTTLYRCIKADKWKGKYKAIDLGYDCEQEEFEPNTSIVPLPESERKQKLSEMRKKKHELNRKKWREIGKEQKREYYASHREEELQRIKEYYITHKQERIEYGKKYRKEIKEGKRICYVRPM